MIVLLDLNYTLAENSPERGTSPPPMTKRLEEETYRLWLVRLLRPHHVILVTARPERWREPTLERIKALTGWSPQEAFFNDRNLGPPAFKEHVLRAHLLPRFEAEEMFAIESNPRTRAMYERYGVPAMPVGERPWRRLPA